MIFTFWYDWFLSFFYVKDDPIDSTKVHGKNDICQGNVEINNSLKSHGELIFDTNEKLEKVVEKIKKYNILGEDEYKYIKTLEFRK